MWTYIYVSNNMLPRRIHGHIVRVCENKLGLLSKLYGFVFSVSDHRYTAKYIEHE
jgi:hypothetical protein